MLGATRLNTFLGFGIVNKFILPSTFVGVRRKSVSVAVFMDPLFSSFNTKSNHMFTRADDHYSNSINVELMYIRCQADKHHSSSHPGPAESSSGTVTGVECN